MDGKEIKTDKMYETIMNQLFKKNAYSETTLHEIQSEQTFNTLMFIQ